MITSSRVSVILLALCFSLAAICDVSWGALTSYMRIEGKSQGVIKGDCTERGKENTILVYGVDHEIEIPKDSQTGLPTGQRIHHPLTIVKHVDVSSPKLAMAICTGEQLDVVTLDFYRVRPDGAEELYYQIKLEQAIIVSKKLVKLNTLDPNYKQYLDMEEISFTYSKITWTYMDGNIEYSDSWKGM